MKAAPCGGDCQLPLLRHAGNNLHKRESVAPAIKVEAGRRGGLGHALGRIYRTSQLKR